MQERELVSTGDGSVTIRISGTDTTYHSLHGALAESRHIFIDMGLHHLLEQQAWPEVHILEIGFGTGLNALLTAMAASDRQQTIRYTTLEPYPLGTDLLAQLNYPALLQQEQLFRQLHGAAWDTAVQISDHFILQKLQKEAILFTPAPGSINLVYFDAFAPEDQPELWTPEMFGQLYNSMCPGAVLTTYCAKGAIRRMMQGCGFSTERIAGPPGGKREILRARKPVPVI